MALQQMVADQALLIEASKKLLRKKRFRHSTDSRGAVVKSYSFSNASHVTRRDYPAWTRFAIGSHWCWPCERVDSGHLASRYGIRECVLRYSSKSVLKRISSGRITVGRSHVQVESSSIESSQAEQWFPMQARCQTMFGHWIASMTDEWTERSFGIWASLMSFRRCVWPLLCLYVLNRTRFLMFSSILLTHGWSHDFYELTTVVCYLLDIQQYCYAKPNVRFDLSSLDSRGKTWS